MVGVAKFCTELSIKVERNEICALCRQEGKLMDSHLLPKALYRYVRWKENRNGSPVIISDKVIRNTDKQFSRHLLCCACEQRFHQKGENWVLRQIYRGGNSFRLLEILDKQTPVHETGAQKIYDVQGVKDIDSEQLSYFALSVFWRAAVSNWKIDNDRLQPLDYGKIYTEALRKYLLDESSFPTNIALTVQVCESPTQVATTLVTPAGTKVDGYHRYGFVIPGILFDLYMGKRIPTVVRQCCIGSGTKRLIFRKNYEQFIKDMVLKKYFKAKLLVKTSG